MPVQFSRLAAHSLHSPLQFTERIVNSSSESVSLPRWSRSGCRTALSLPGWSRSGCRPTLRSRAISAFLARKASRRFSSAEISASTSSSEREASGRLQYRCLACETQCAGGSPGQTVAQQCGDQRVSPAPGTGNKSKAALGRNRLYGWQTVL